MEKTARKENRTMSELVRETFRRYQPGEEDRRLAADPVRARRLLDLQQAVEQLRKEAARSSLTTRQINSEVEAHRRQRRKNRIEQPVR
jgi:hypothetical protein